MALSESMQASRPASHLSSTPFPSLNDVYTKLSAVSRNNLFKIIKFQLFLLYSLHFILHGFMFREFTSDLATGIFFISFLLIVLQQSINDILHHVNGAFFVIFTILIFSNGSYSHKIGLYLPQLSLITTNNKHFAIFLQGLLFFVATLFRFEKFSASELYSSTLLVGALLVILQVLSKVDFKNENLKAEVDSLEAQLKSTQNRLQESYNFNRDFHLTISHEFRNPLNNVMGNIELVQKNLHPGDANQEHIKMAKLGCEILLNSLNNTLDYCKIESDEIDVNYVSVNIRKCLEKSWIVFSEVLRLRGLQGELYLHANVPPMVMMDPGRLHQVLLNLIHNSSKFTSKGYVKVIVSWHPCFVSGNDGPSRFSSQQQISYGSPTSKGGISRNNRTSTPDLAKIKRSTDMSWMEDEFSEFPCSSQKITFSPSMNYAKLDLHTRKFPRLLKRHISDLSEPIGFLKIQVLDSGVGIHKSNLPKVFQKFSKFSHDAIPRVEGSGLGLWVTKKICNKMDGTIHVESELNKGSTFIVFLKCEISPQSMGTPTPSPCLSARRSGIQTMGTMPFIGLKGSKTEPIHNTAQKENGKTDDQVKLKAMVVDDIPYNQHLNKQFLELCGVEVKYVAGNGLEAYKRYVESENDPLDLIFMDLDMPVMDGKTSCTKIREWEKSHKAKPVTIVILTGNCSEHELKQCLDKTGNIKADYFYRKPLPLPDCQNLVQQIKREKTKKKSLMLSLPKMADQVLICEKDLFQQVLLENYLRVGQIKYYVSNKDTVFEKFTKFSDSICAVLYNCESVEDFEESKRFVAKAQEFMRSRGRKEIPILGIIKEGDKEVTMKLRQIGFTDFLIKPFDFENIVRLLRSHTMNGMFG